MKGRVRGFACGKFTVKIDFPIAFQYETANIFAPLDESPIWYVNNSIKSEAKKRVQIDVPNVYATTKTRPWKMHHASTWPDRKYRQQLPSIVRSIWRLNELLSLSLPRQKFILAELIIESCELHMKMKFPVRIAWQSRCSRIFELFPSQW